MTWGQAGTNSKDHVAVVRGTRGQTVRLAGKVGKQAAIAGSLESVPDVGVAGLAGREAVRRIPARVRMEREGSPATGGT